METLWRGNANAWECDELGHLNVRFYIAKAMEAVAGLSDTIGMRGAYSERATATLIPRELTVRFLAEARPGAPLSIRGGVTAHDATGLEAVLLLDHAARGVPAAAFTVRLEHAAPATGKVFPFARRTRAALDLLQVQRPAETAARSLSTGAPERAATLTRADELGLEEISRGRIAPEETDMFARMRPEIAIAKVSDGVVHFQDAFPEQWNAMRQGRAPEAASAVLEARLVYHRFPPAGSGFVIRTGLSDVAKKIRTLVHWAFDPASGAHLWSMEAVACLMDLKARKLRAAAPDALATMNARLVKGLKP